MYLEKQKYLSSYIKWKKLQPQSVPSESSPKLLRNSSAVGYLESKISKKNENKKTRNRKKKNLSGYNKRTEKQPHNQAKEQLKTSSKQSKRAAQI